MKRPVIAAVSLLLCAVAGQSACGAKTGLDELYVANASGGAGGSGASGGGGNGVGGVEPPECVVFESQALLAPLDVFVMLDASGSMEFEISPGQTKWSGMRDALAGFAFAPESQGIGVALSFFPIVDTSVAELCTDGGLECGDPMYCHELGYCPTGQVTCETTEDCATQGFPNDLCLPYTVCKEAPFFFCDALSPCNANVGPCVIGGYCENRFTCDVPPYATPVLSVGKLPGAAGALLAAFDDKIPDGATPTLPAVTGAVASAQSWAAANPSHKVIVLLATDGFPTVCDPELELGDQFGIENVAQVAAQSALGGVEVFVIGVFSPNEEMEAVVNLGAIAAAGGTEQAFVITTGGNASEQLLEAFEEIRKQAKSCEFDLAPAGPVDFSQVWVRITSSKGGQVWVKLVESAAACDPNLGGFHYDVPLDSGQTPSRVVLCPATCDLVDASLEPLVEIFTTCADPMGER